MANIRFRAVAFPVVVRRATAGTLCNKGWGLWSLFDVILRFGKKAG